jgi:ADP-ribose pyrophosphatase YjhB (NUDIX family)
MNVQQASSAILIRNGRLLLVKRKNPPAANMYAFPGGRANPGENPAETAIREVFEETGIVVANPVEFMTFDLRHGPDGPHFFLTVFLVGSEDPHDGEAADDAAEIGWFLPGEVDALPAPESVRTCLNALLAGGHI